MSAIATEAEQRDKVEAVESEEDAGSPDISDLMAAWSQSVAVIWERATPEQRAVFVRWLSTQ